MKVNKNHKKFQVSDAFSARLSASFRSFAPTQHRADHVKRPDSEIHSLTILFPLRAPSVCGNTGCALAPPGLFVPCLFASSAAGGIRSCGTENANIYKCIRKNKLPRPRSALFPGRAPVSDRRVPASGAGFRQPRDRDFIYGCAQSRYPLQLSVRRLRLDRHPKPRVP